MALTVLKGLPVLANPPVSVYSAGSASIWRAGLKEIVTLTGMILVSSPLKEYDKRIEILTREQGRIPAFAQGARKQNSALSACTVPFTFGEFQVYEGRNSYSLKSGIINSYFGSLANDYDLLCYASYFTEIARYLTRENVRADGELLLLYITFKALQAGKVPVQLIRRIFELRFMAVQGEAPGVFACVRCGNTDAYNVYMAEGGLVCADCQKKDIQLKNYYPVKLSTDARYALQYIISSPFEKLYSFNLSGSVMAEVNGFMEKYLSRYLPHHFKSAEFLMT